MSLQNFMQSMRKIYAILVEHVIAWNWTFVLCLVLMGGNYYKTVDTTYNFILKSSRKLTNSLLLISIQLSSCDQNTPLKMLVDKTIVQSSLSAPIVLQPISDKVYSITIPPKLLLQNMWTFRPLIFAS